MVAVTSARCRLPFVLIPKQWTVSGVAGLCGQLVQNHVVKASKREAVPAQTQDQPMEETNALVKLNRRRVATLSLVQVCSGAYEF